MSGVGALLRVAPGSRVALRDEDARATPGWSGGKAAARQDLAALGPRLADLQERLWAEGTVGGSRSLVVLLQGTDASGKDGVSKKVLGLLAPRGLAVRSFGRPTEEEQARGFLWRVEQALPPPGWIAAWNRSHYEDVLAARVRGLVPRETWEPRFGQIAAWERDLVASGTVLLKVLLQISPQEQAERLRARLDRPEKHWKVDPGDHDDRRLWEQYRQAQEDVLRRTSTDEAPWHVVPADRKWYRDWAVGHLLLEALEGMDPQWPVRPELDLDALRASLDERLGNRLGDRPGERPGEPGA